MRFRVVHRTEYEYERPVFLEPHTFRLCPRAAGNQRLLDFRLQIQPRPAGLAEALDGENNGIHFVWFEGVTDRLTVVSSFEVETFRSNPFDFILPDISLATLPIEYDEDLRVTLGPYLQSPRRDRSVFEFARGVAQEVRWRTLDFVTALNQRLYGSCTHITREDGAPQTAAVTLATRTGACRDLAILFVECARAMGIAARFVSGYELNSAQEDRVHMHAWAEVFVPGGGWRGFDPSRGLAAAERHIAVAAGRLPHMAAPVTGLYRGDAGRTMMGFDITMEELAGSAA